MPSGEITQTLERIREGDGAATEALVALVYDDLRKIAARLLRGERSDHTLQATALVHEAWLRLLGRRAVPWENRVHFFSAAATAMRHVLVDHARAVRAQRRGGGRTEVALTDSLSIPAGVIQVEEILTVDEALDRLNRISSRQKTIVEMRFYAGFSEEEIAELLQLSPRTVRREWAVARAWLHGECAPIAADADSASLLEYPKQS